MSRRAAAVFSQRWHLSATSPRQTSTPLPGVSSPEASARARGAEVLVVPTVEQTNPFARPDGRCEPGRPFKLATARTSIWTQKTTPGSCNATCPANKWPSSPGVVASSNGRHETTPAGGLPTLDGGLRPDSAHAGQLLTLAASTEPLDIPRMIRNRPAAEAADPQAAPDPAGRAGPGLADVEVGIADALRAAEDQAHFSRCLARRCVGREWRRNPR